MGKRKKKRKRKNQHQFEDDSDLAFNELPKPWELRKMYKNLMKELELVMNNYNKMIY